MLNKITAQGKIREIFILPDGSKQLLINNIWYHEKTATPKARYNLEHYYKILKKVNPDSFDLWQLEFILRALKNDFSDTMMQAKIKFDLKYSRKRKGLSKRNLGEILNTARLKSGIEFYIKENTKKGQQCKSDF